MKAVLITIGDEILIGQVIDTNSAWLAEELTQLGIKVHRILSISDAKEEILNALSQASEIADLVILTGGLGPTKDDITKQCFAEFFDTSLELDDDILNLVRSYFDNIGVQMPKANEGQALVPKGGIAVKNKNGTAPGMWFEKDQTVFISLPGVPYEMKALMQEDFFPMISKHFKTPEIFHKTVLTQGIGESSLMEIISDWEDSLSAQNMKLAYLPQPGMVRLRITATGNDNEQLEKKVKHKIEKLKELIPTFIWGFDKQKLEEVIGQKLIEKGKTLATAESCTGGYISHLITSISGSSKYFLGSVVSYDNRVKVEQLKVSEAGIQYHGAVSKQVVEQMALGVKNELNTDYAIATSGIAGPNGGTNDKPVGTTWIAIATPDKVISEKFLFGNHRERNIRKTALQAMNMLRKEI